MCSMAGDVCTDISRRRNTRAIGRCLRFLCFLQDATASCRVNYCKWFMADWLIRCRCGVNWPFFPHSPTRQNGHRWFRELVRCLCTSTQERNHTDIRAADRYGGILYEIGRGFTTTPARVVLWDWASFTVDDAMVAPDNLQFPHTTVVNTLKCFTAPLLYATVFGAVRMISARMSLFVHFRVSCVDCSFGVSLRVYCSGVMYDWLIHQSLQLFLCSWHLSLMMMLSVSVIVCIAVNLGFFGLFCFARPRVIILRQIWKVKRKSYLEVWSLTRIIFYNLQKLG